MIAMWPQAAEVACTRTRLQVRPQHCFTLVYSSHGHKQTVTGVTSCNSMFCLLCVTEVSTCCGTMAVAYPKLRDQTCHVTCMIIHELITGSVRNCTFTSNRVGGSGGGLFQNQFRGDVAVCVFTSNSARSGGAIYQNAATGSTSDSLFTGNGAERGGAIYQVCLLLLTCHDLSFGPHL